MPVKVSCGSRHPDRFRDPPAADLGLRIASSGAYALLAWCHECGRWASGAIPTYHLDRLGLRADDIRVVADHRGSLGRCSVRGCDSEDVELNHFAPQATFGEASWDWPTAYLCRRHHREWGERVTPHLNRPRRTA